MQEEIAWTRILFDIKHKQLQWVKQENQCNIATSSADMLGLELGKVVRDFHDRP